MSVQSFRDLEVWKKSMLLVTEIYELTKSFPKEEMYGLTSQIRRSAVSVPSNIAEGRGKRSTRDYIRFLNIAYGSIAELETQIEIAFNLKYISEQTLKNMLANIQPVCRMLNGLISSLERRNGDTSRILNPESRIRA